jgi:ligand-binding sensor domain-containing protein
VSRGTVRGTFPVRTHGSVLGLLAFILLNIYTAPGVTRDATSLPPVEIWRDLPTVNETYNIAASGSTVWWHSSDQLFRYNRQTGAITTYTSANGLLPGAIYSLAIDQQGVVWVGGAVGISRYDGAGWSYVRAGDGSDLDVTALTLSSDGTLWASIAGQLFRYDGSWRHMPFDAITNPTNICSPSMSDVEVAGSHIWKVAPGAATCYFDGTVWDLYPIEGESFSAREVALSPDGALWFGWAAHKSNYGHGRLTPAGGWSLSVIPIQELVEGTGGLAIGANGHVYVASPSGVNRFDGQSWSAVGGFDYSPTYHHDLALAPDNSIWASGRLVNWYDGSRWRTVLAAPFGQPLLALDDGRLWFVDPLRRMGLAYYDGQQWRRYSKADGAPHNGASHAVMDGNGDFWFAMETEGDVNGIPPVGLARFDGTHWQHFPVGGDIPGRFVYGMTVDGAGDVWIGYYGAGISTYKNGGWQHFSQGSGILSEWVTGIYAEGDTIWVRYSGTDTISSLVGNEWTHYSSDELPDYIWGFFDSDAAGQVWAAGTNGLSWFDGATWQMTPYPAGFPGFEPSGHGIDKQGRHWVIVGSSRYEYQGRLVNLFKYDGNTWTPYGQEITALGDLKGPVIVSPNGNDLYVVAERGVVKLADIFQPTDQLFLPVVRR